MQGNQTRSGYTPYAGRDVRQVNAILCIVTAGVVAALMLPLWMAVAVIFLALCAIRIIAVAETAIAPAVIRRDERR